MNSHFILLVSWKHIKQNTRCIVQLYLRVCDISCIFSLASMLENTIYTIIWKHNLYNCFAIAIRLGLLFMHLICYIMFCNGFDALSVQQPLQQQFNYLSVCVAYVCVLNTSFKLTCKRSYAWARNGSSLSFPHCRNTIWKKTKNSYSVSICIEKTSNRSGEKGERKTVSLDSTNKKKPTSDVTSGGVCVRTATGSDNGRGCKYLTKHMKIWNGNNNKKTKKRRNKTYFVRQYQPSIEFIRCGMVQQSDSNVGIFFLIAAIFCCCCWCCR